MATLGDEYSHEKFHDEVLDMTDHFSAVIEEHIEHTHPGILAAAMSICLGCYVASTAASGSDLEDKIAMVVKTFTREARQGFLRTLGEDDDDTTS